MKGKPDLKRQNIICMILLIVLLAIFAISLILAIRLEDDPYHTGLFVSPLSVDETPDPAPVYQMLAPIVPKYEPQPWTDDPAKGAACFAAPRADCLPLLGASFDFGCPTEEYPNLIQYLASVQAIQNVGASLPCSNPVALLNECDNSYYDCPDNLTTVQAIHTLATSPGWDETLFFFGCNAFGPQYSLDLISLYEQHYGPAPVAGLCGHCYSNAETCIDEIAEYTQASIDHLDNLPVWITEFGSIPGLTGNLANSGAETSCLVRSMRDNPSVARFRYWPGYTFYGRWVPGRPCPESWCGLLFPEFVSWPVTYHWKRTYLGDLYAFHEATWDECWYPVQRVRWDQIPQAGKNSIPFEHWPTMTPQIYTREPDEMVVTPTPKE